MTRPSGPRWSSVGSSGPMKQRSVTSNTACSRLLAVSSGQNSRNVPPPSGSVRARRTRRACSSPDGRGVLVPWLPARARRRAARTARGPGAAAPARSRPPLAYGVADIRLSPSGREGPQLRHEPAVVVEQLVGPVGSAATPRASAGAPGCPRPRTAAPGGPGWCPRPARRRRRRGPVQPLGVRSTMAGHACRTCSDGRRRRAPLPGSRGSGRGRATSAAYRSGNTCAGSSPLDDDRVPALAAQVGLDVLVGGAAEHRRPGDLVAVEVQDRQHRAVAAGVEEGWAASTSRESGPVSASPSPTTQATKRSGWSKAAPAACASAYPSSPPSWMLPGVCTLTWLGMPPGEENWRNSVRHALGVGADVRVDLGVGALEVGGGDQCGAAVPGTGDVEPVGAGLAG